MWNPSNWQFPSQIPDPKMVPISWSSFLPPNKNTTKNNPKIKSQMINVWYSSLLIYHQKIRLTCEHKYNLSHDIPFMFHLQFWPHVFKRCLKHLVTHRVWLEPSRDCVTDLWMAYPLPQQPPTPCQRQKLEDHHPGKLWSVGRFFARQPRCMDLGGMLISICEGKLISFEPTKHGGGWKMGSFPFQTGWFWGFVVVFGRVHGSKPTTFGSIDVQNMWTS